MLCQWTVSGTNGLLLGAHVVRLAEEAFQPEAGQNRLKLKMGVRSVQDTRVKANTATLCLVLLSTVPGEFGRPGVHAPGHVGVGQQHEAAQNNRRLRMGEPIVQDNPVKPNHARQILVQDGP